MWLKWAAMAIGLPGNGRECTGGFGNNYYENTIRLKQKDGNGLPDVSK